MIPIAVIAYGFITACGGYYVGMRHRDVYTHDVISFLRALLGFFVTVTLFTLAACFVYSLVSGQIRIQL